MIRNGKNYKNRRNKMKNLFIKLLGLDIKKYLCPLGGDEHNDCKDCVYSGDYHFDKKTGECVVRK